MNIPDFLELVDSWEKGDVLERKSTGEWKPSFKSEPIYVSLFDIKGSEYRIRPRTFPAKDDLDLFLEELSPGENFENLLQCIIDRIKALDKSLEELKNEV